MLIIFASWQLLVQVVPARRKCFEAHAGPLMTLHGGGQRVQARPTGRTGSTLHQSGRTDYRLHGRYSLGESRWVQGRKPGSKAGGALQAAEFALAASSLAQSQEGHCICTMGEVAGGAEGALEETQAVESALGDKQIGPDAGMLLSLRDRCSCTRYLVAILLWAAHLRLPVRCLTSAKSCDKNSPDMVTQMVCNCPGYLQTAAHLRVPIWCLRSAVTRGQLLRSTDALMSRCSLSRDSRALFACSSGLQGAREHSGWCRWGSHALFACTASQQGPRNAQAGCSSDL